MKCLSTRQPWAWAICVGAKNIENKSGRTTHRGLVAIHAGLNQSVAKSFVRESGKKIQLSWFFFGAIVGVAEIVDVMTMDEKLEPNSLAFGPQCWVMGKGQLFTEPIPLKGQLGLFELSPAIENQVRQRMNGPAKVPTVEEKSLFLQTARSSPLDAALSRAASYLELDKYADAIRHYDTAIQLDPDNAMAFTIRAGSYASLGDFAATIRDCNAALRIQPDLVLANLYRGQALANLGREQEAQADLDKWVEWERKHPEEGAVEDEDE